jgi:hypothetical protein
VTSIREDQELRDRPVGELMRELAEETSTLVRQELELAKAEMAQKGRRAGPGIGMVGAAAVIGLAALGALTAFFILALDGAIANWLAALIVALVYAAIAAGLYFAGRERVKEAGPPVPERTAQSVREDVQEVSRAKARAGT